MRNPIKCLKRWIILLSTVLILSFTSIVAVAQQPIVTSIDKTTATAGEIVSISGSNFGIVKTDLQVFFGATKGFIKSATDQLIEVEVPTGATYNNISVTRKQASGPGLTGYSDVQFLLNFNGKYDIDPSKFDTQQDFPAASGLYDLCMCDFDGDKKNDIASVGESINKKSVIIHGNSSSPGTINYVSKNNLTIEGTSLNTTCGDLNGDGKPDLIVTTKTTILTTVINKIYIYQNKSTGIDDFSFGDPSILFFDGRTPSIAAIADLNLDGLPEVVFTDQTSNKIGILLNQSTASTISISTTPIDFITSATGESSDAIAIEDLNGDHLPEIITSKYQVGNSHMYILKNTSQGSVSFSDAKDITLDKPLLNNVKRIRIGDLDGDGKPDIVATRWLSNNIAIYLNTSTVSNITFAPFKDVFTKGERPWGLDMGDLDGDGKTDIVISSTKENRLTILNNKSTPGTLNFDIEEISTFKVTRHIQIGDVDGDGKHDITFASIDDALVGLASKVSVLRNKACMIPKIFNEGPLNICVGNALKLTSTQSPGATYTWLNNNVPVNTGVNTGNPFYDVPTNVASANNSYTVLITPQAGNIVCTEASTPSVAVTVSSGTPPNSTNQIKAVGPICSGGTLTLELESPIAGATYKWGGPGGYSYQGATGSIPNFSAQNAGKYWVDIIMGTCLAKTFEKTFEVIDLEGFKVMSSGSNMLCNGDAPKTLTVSPTPAGFTYAWYERTLGNLNKSGTTLSVTSSGDYFVKASSPSCSPPDTEPLKITVVTKPTVDFSFDHSAACVGQNIIFTSTITNATPLVDLFYKWEFGDGEISSERNPTHKYLSATPKTPKLTVSYSTNGVCEASKISTSSIDVKTAPLAQIISPGNTTFQFCKGETLTLALSNSFDTYTWSNGKTGASIDVSESGNYTVTVTTGGCTLDAAQTIKASYPEIIISADPAKIDEGQSSQLTASGLVDYNWIPSETLSNSIIATPIASPIVTTTYTITGHGLDGCPGSATFELLVKGEPLVNKLKPSNIISPDGNGKNDHWNIEKILEFPTCTVAIYDIKGVKIFEAKPYINNWDGTYKGKKLPDGVYYYVIRCDGEESHPRSGSITLLK